MDNWQPIETAPRDGTPILLWLNPPLKSNDVIGWCPIAEIRCVVGWAVDDYADRVEWNCGFTEEGSADTDGYSSAFMISIKPLAWQPLPNPPVSK